MKSLLLDALHGCNQAKRPPVWLMRQAGRYMPEYRALRAKYSFLEMCHQPELIAEVTLQPIQAFGMDAAILFSDILVIPEALGLGLHIEEKVGPWFERPLSSPEEIASLPSIDMQEALNYVYEGINLVRPSLNIPLIGFCGGPFTMASYMIEGKSSHRLAKTKQWMLSDPSSFHRLLQLLANYCIDYLKMQIRAGVTALQIFDSWASVLAFPQFQEFSLNYLQQIVAALKPTNNNPGIPIILFCRGSSVFATEIAKISPSAISVDWNANLQSLRQVIPSSIALQGNLDPDILCTPLHVVKKETTKLLDSMRGDPAYIFNLGHGITPDVPVDAVKTLVECVKNYQ